MIPNLRCGDTVKHLFSGETWEVAYADYASGYLSPCGWPEGEAKIAECDLVERCSDEEHKAAVSRWLDHSHRSDNGRQDRRVGMVRRLYRPEEEARLVRQAIGVDCLSLADRIVRAFGSESSIAGQLRLFAATDCVAEIAAAARSDAP